MTLLDIISIIIVTANIILGAFILSRNYKKKSNAFFFLMAFAVSGWAGCNWLVVYSVEPSLVHFWGKMTFFFASAIPAILIFFGLNFPKKYYIKSELKIIVTLFALTFMALSLTPLIEAGVTIVDHTVRNEIITDYGPVYPLFAVYFLSAMIYGFYILFKQHSRLRGIERLKMKYVLYSWLFVAIVGVSTNLVWSIGSTILVSGMNRFTHIGPLFSVVMTIAIAYAIYKHRLMDINLVIKRGFVHFISIVIVLFLYIYLLIFSKQSFQSNYDWSEQTTTILLVVIIALTVEPLRRLLVKVIDKIFYSDKKNTREETRKLRTIMSSSLQFDQLIKRIRTEFSEFLNAESIQFIWLNKQKNTLENYYPDERRVQAGSETALFRYLREQASIIVTEEIPYLREEKDEGEQQMLESVEGELKAMGVWLVVPVGEPGELVGAFFFGKKENKEAYTADNLLYLQRLQPQMTGAIANALLYKQAVERIGRT